MINIQEAEGLKCPRCWKRCGIESNFDNLCDRCVEAILESFPNHPSVPHIKAALLEQKKRWLK